ncbi:D-inositol-3-phosphate glycosyltransferase [ANME-1 cluster archaeon GoMg1]|nr:D-inositol-3-phosphate glycosyltransferase [ANME-1 cluster archaeon GoMg1]
MKIAILVKEFPPEVIGGTEVQTMRMAEELGRKHEVIVFTKRYKSDAKYNYHKHYGIVRIPNIRFNGFLSTLTFVLLTPFFIMKYRKKIDVLQCMMIYPNGFIGLLLNKLFEIPFFSWIRGGDWYFAKNNRIKRKMIASVLRNSLVVVQSNEIKKDVESEFPEANLKIIPNAVDILGIRANGEYIIFVGNLIERKGVKYLIKAMKNVKGKLIIVGDGPERKKLEKLAQSLEVNCEFVGAVAPEKVSEYLMKGKLFVLPAVKGEGFPNVILEAMSVGLPVVATSLGGIPDLVKNGETGFLVKPADVEALAGKITEIVNNDSLWSIMSDNCLKEVKRYSWDNIIRQIEGVYESCVE